MKKFTQFLEASYGATLGLFESVEARHRGEALLEETKRQREIERNSDSVHLQENQ